CREPMSTHVPYTTLFRSERGTHGALLAKAGVYAQMWNLQQQQRDLELTSQRLAFQPLNPASLVVDVVDGLRDALEERRVKLYVRSEEHTSELQSRENIVC